VDDFFAVLLSNPAGGFFPAKLNQPTLGGPIRDLVLLDANRDGIQDVLFTDSSSDIFGFNGLPGGEFVEKYRQAGIASDLNLGNPLTLAVGDFNGDGIPDFMAPGNSTFSLTVFLGNGDGTYRYEAAFGGAGVPIWAVAGKFTDNTRPGKDDLVIANGDGSISLLINTTP
jgi:hypothetical protein